jgi:disulfide bond formation protein DsbB
MKNIDWRIRIIGGILMLVGAGVAVQHALTLRAMAENYNHMGVLALIAFWGGCDSILKGIQVKQDH